MENKRIVVCSECGCLYDLHYVDGVMMRKGGKYRFNCKNCGMVDTVYKNMNDLEDFQKEEVGVKE